MWIKKPLTIALLLASSQAYSAFSLMDVYQMSLQHDAVLAQAKAKYEADQQVVTTAKAPLLPQINAKGSYGKNNSSINSGDVTTRDLSVTVNQSLYKRDNWARYDQSKFQLQNAKYAVRNAEQNLIVRVANAYFKVLLSQQDLSLAKAKEKADQTQWDRANASAEVGLASKTDVLQAKSSYDLSKSDRITAENNLDVAYEELMKLTGKPVHALKVVALNTQLPAQNLVMTEWEAKAKAHNLTALQAQAQSEVAAQEIKVQASGHWFDVGLQASYDDKAYSDYAAGMGSVYKNKNDLYVGAYVNIPIYSGGGVSSKVTEARFNYKSANEALRNAREQAVLDARIQVRSIERGMSLVSALREAVKSNDAFLEAAEEGYKVGLKNLLEVLTARTNKFKARRDLTDAIHKLILARLQLEATVGQLNEAQLKKFNALLTDPSDQTGSETAKP